MHIFWQRRINDGDVTTPHWYPSMTDQGAIRPAPAKATLDAPKTRTPRKPKPPQAKGPVTSAAFNLRFAPVAAAAASPKPKRERAEKPKVKIAAELVAKARELRDRYLEQVNDRLLLAPSGKYDVARAVPAAPVVPLLQAG